MTAYLDEVFWILVGFFAGIAVQQLLPTSFWRRLKGIAPLAFLFLGVFGTAVFTNPNCVGNCVDGFGIYTFASGVVRGTKYEGEFKYEKYNGQGRITLANGDKYVGEFKDGKANGQGTFTKSDGTVQTGLWIDNKFVGKN